MKKFSTSTLKKIVSPVERPAVPIPGQQYRQIGVQLWGRGAYEREPLDGGQTKYRTLSRVEKDDIIVNKIWARNGSVAVVPASLAGCYASGEFPIFSPIRDKLEPRWFHWITKTVSFWAQCDEKSRGTSGKNRIRPEKFLEIEIPLPPLPEQRRIVGRIEELSAKIEDARVLRGQASEATQAILANTTASVLKHRLWPLRTMEELVGRANLKNGISLKSTGDSGVRCLRISSMRNGRIDCADSKPVPMSTEQSEPYFVRPGDVFVVRGNGSKELVGRAGLVEKDCKGLVFPDLFIRVPLDNTVLLASFFVAVWNSAYTREFIHHHAKTTSGIWKINQHHISSISIPVPSIPEQLRIVAYLDDLQAKVDTVKKLQEESEQELNALMPSILSRAFAGEL